MKVLSFGSMNIDYVYSVPHIIQPGETLSSSGRKIFVGGKGLNQSVAMAKAGLPVYHAGMIGNDGALLRETLENSGVNTENVLSADALSGHTVIQVDEDGQNSIILFHGTNYMIDDSFIDSVLAHFEAGDLIVLQNEISSLQSVLVKAAEKGLYVVLNPSPFEEQLRTYPLDKVSLFMINEIEGAQISGESSEDPAAILDWFTAHFPVAEVILTLGANGAWYSGSGERFYQEAFRIKAVDTTSAGDTFSGYFIYGKVNGLSVPDALRLAAKASSITCSRPGAAPSIPTLEEVTAAF